MRGWPRDLLLVLLGAALGYLAAAQTRVGRARLPQNLPQRAEAYYRTHPNEVVIGGVLVAIILLLLFTRRGGGTARARR